MERKQGGLIPIGKALSGLGGPVKELREATPQALNHFTRFDQVNQLVMASEADPDLGFMVPLIGVVLVAPHQSWQPASVQAGQRPVQAHHVLKR